MKNAVSRFGKFLSGMVMPNIGAFIAWGFLTALFIEAGWFPNEKLASMGSPMLTYLLPILIGRLLQKKELTVQVLPTRDKWFGMTYPADKQAVTESFRELIDAGVYQKDLYSDL